MKKISDWLNAWDLFFIVFEVTVSLDAVTSQCCHDVSY